ncbi:GMC family oxidoreductase [Mesorhizobium sp. ANAO-SY3R2]|uniref:GMC family oxidoreductase n=1 Tax=Mesorhizobium sp. ANAO-SY3R2 TaxID=3166644 RepID=UPI0036706A72
MQDVADYVIVGAGSAGCVVANRLSADPRNRVLVLEAGGSDLSPWVRMPIGYGKTFYHADMNWRYVSEAEPGLGGRTTYWPRGRVLGGSSSINAMVFIRGQREDFDGWERLGNPGWGFGDVLPAFKRMEDNSAGADEWRATGGPLGVSCVADRVHPLCANYLAAGVDAGLMLNPDFNGATQEGVGTYQITTRNGFRSSAATAYLRPAMRRSNLNVVTRAQVTRILFEGRRAVGVEYQRGNELHTVKVRGEVILSAGAVNSPQLLQLSGVGDPMLLAGLGIPVVHAAKGVGENLQDHLGFDYLYRSRRPTLNDQLRPWWGRLMVGAHYLFNRGGPLSLSVNQGGGFFRTNPARERPNMQLYFSPLSYTKAVPGKRQLMRPDPFPGFMLGVSNCHPTSRGHIRIRSADPFQAPSIQPNYLSTAEDLEELVEAAAFLRKFAAQAPLAELIDEELQPGTPLETRAEIEEDIRQRSGSIFHASGTCAMGPDPASAVVDARLRVHGLEGLRVVDASIFPRLTAGNINAPTIMVGERGADFLIADRR